MATGTGGSGSQNVNIGANFTGASNFQSFQQGMRDNIAVADRFGIAIGQLNAQNAIFGSFMSGTNFSNNFNAQINGIENAFKGFNLQMKNVLSGLQSINLAGASMFSNLTNAFNNNNIFIRATAGADRYLLSLQGIARIAQAQVIARYTQAVSQAFDDGIKSAADYDVKIAAIRTISQDTATTQDQWKRSIRALSDEFGNPLLDTAAGTYEAISNQVAKGTASIRFMTSAMEFARTTLATTADSVNLLSSVINAYGKNAEDVEDISASLFRTIELGRVTATEIANILGPAAVSANLLGVAFEELETSVAILTSQGTHANTALTLTSNLIQKLVKPSMAMKKVFDEWNVSSGEAAIATYGFAGVVEKLGEIAKRGGLTELADDLKDLRAIRAAAGLTGGNILGNFDDVLKQIKEGTESYQKAQAIIAQSAGAMFKKEVNKIQNLMTIDLGNAMLEFLIQMSGGLGQATEVIKGTTDALLAIVKTMVSGVAIVGSFAAGIQVLTGELSGATILLTGFVSRLALLNLTMMRSPWLAALTSLLVAATTIYALIVDRTRKTKEAEDKAIADMLAEEEKAHEKSIKMIKERVAEDDKATAKIVKNANQAIAAITGGWKEFNKSVGANAGGVEDYEKAVKKFLDSLKDAAKNTTLADLGGKITEGLKAPKTISSLKDVASNVEKMIDIVNVAMNQNNPAQAMAAFDAYKDKVKDVQQSITDFIKDSLKRQEDATKSFADRKFDLTVGKMSNNKAKTAITDEVERLKSEAIRLAGSGDAVGSESALKRAEGLAKELTERLDNKKSSKAPDLTLEESVLNTRLNVEKQLSAQAKMIDPLKNRVALEANITKQLEDQNRAIEARKRASETLQKIQMELNNAKKALEESGNMEKTLASDKTTLVGNIKSQSLRAKQAAGRVTGYNTNKRTSSVSQAIGINAFESFSNVLEVVSSKLARGDTSAAIKDFNLAKLEFDATDWRGIKTGKDDVDALNLAFLSTKDSLQTFMDKEQEAKTASANKPALQQQVEETDRILKLYTDTYFPERFKQITDATAKPLEAASNVLIKARSDLLMDIGIGFKGMQPEVGKPAGMNQGGILRGPSGFDNLGVNAMAGEAFIPREMTARYYPQIKSMIQGTHPTTNANTYNLSFHMAGTGTTESSVREMGTMLLREIKRGRLPPLT